MQETSKCIQLREDLKHWEKYLNGKGIDIGAGNDPLDPPHGYVFPFDMQHGDANYMDNVPDDEYNFVYSSHCLEHMVSVRTSLFNWMRICKPEKYIYVVIPDYELYEKKLWPSRFNGDHKQTFSTKIGRSDVGRLNHWHIKNDIEPIVNKLGGTIEEIILQDNGYNYNLEWNVDQTQFPNVLAQICMIIKKGKKND